MSARLGHASCAGQAGFSIVETMFASLILAIAFLGMTSVHAVSSRAQTLGEHQGLATYIADQQLELMRRSSFAAVTSATTSVVQQGVSFAVTRTVSTVGSNKRVEVVASWNDRFGTRSVRLATVVSQVTNP